MITQKKAKQVNDEKTRPISVFLAVGVERCAVVQTDDVFMVLKNREGEQLPIIFRLESVAEFGQKFNATLQQAITRRRARVTPSVASIEKGKAHDSND